jgi:hypothetical protein
MPQFCIVQDCGKYARGASGKCSGHKGGVRCSIAWCQNGAQGKNGRCKRHKNGNKCVCPDCPDEAVSFSALHIKVLNALKLTALKVLVEKLENAKTTEDLETNYV